MTGRHLALLVAAGAAVWSVAAEAQPYPARPITIVVPYAAGGLFDTMARIIGARMGELLGQSVMDSCTATNPVQSHHRQAQAAKGLAAQIGGIHLVVGQRECWPMPLTPAAHVRVGAAVP